MPLSWENNVPPQPSPGSSPDHVGLPSRDALATVNEASAVEASVLQASILELLEEHRHEVETLLERHRLALRRAVERVSIFAKAAVPVAEALGPAGASQAEASAADGAAGASSAAGPSSGEVSCALPSSANAAAPVAEDFAQGKVDASKVKPAAGRTSADTAGEDPSVSAEVTETVTKPPQDAPPPADSRSAKATELVAPAQDAPPLAVIAGASADASVTPRTSMACADAPGTPSSSAHTPGQKRAGTFIKRLATNETQEFPEGSVRARLFLEMRGPRFEALSGVLILANTVTTFMQLHFDGQKARAVLHDGAADEAHHTKAVFDALSIAFAVIFLAELTLKLYVHRCAYFHEKFNTIDAVIVAMSSIDALIDASNLNLAFLRTTKILRLARVFRVIRTMNVFTELRVLMKTIVLSFRSMIWSMMILFIFMLVGALLLCQLQQETIKDDAVDMAVREKAFDYYGTPEWALYTIFEATFSGCWPGYARTLIEEVSAWFAAFFVLYVILIVFTLVRIIYALLLKDTLQAAANDADQQVHEKSRETKALVAKLSDLFSQADTSGDGYLSRKEFDRIFGFSKVQTWMGALGVDSCDTKALFDILDEGNGPDGRISVEEFVNGIMRMKGQTHVQDFLRNMRDTSRILKYCEALHSEVKKLQGLHGL